MLTGLASGAKTKDYLFTASIATRPCGPLFFLGLHCALFRRVMPPRFDIFFIIAILLVAIAPLIFVLILQEPGASDLIGFFDNCADDVSIFQYHRDQSGQNFAVKAGPLYAQSPR